MLPEFQMPKRIEVDRATRTNYFGRFTAEPFERGFGTTVGNSLRRILLSSLEGAAVTHVRLKGADHEFTSLNGVTEDVEFDMTLTVAKGRGYITAADNIGDGEEQELGLIAVDSIFSPVTRVRYSTEDARVGQKTDYDRLILEVWTNGTVSPEMAVVEAAKILRKHLNPFVQYFELGSDTANEEALTALRDSGKALIDPD